MPVTSVNEGCGRVGEMRYRHVQHAPRMYLISGLGASLGIVTIAWDDGLGAARWWLLSAAVLLIAVGVVTARLTATVDEQSVTAAFGRGWPRRQIELDEIEEAAVVRNSWWHGWGIRKVSRGWMFNNSGRGAVKLTLRSGKVFRIGTDQPVKLLAALEAAPRSL